MAQPTPHFQPRVMRVFISSTFVDMHAERDELVRRVFPQLRKLCEDRGVVWGEVDLRWGVTDEQQAEAKVLPICLAEIRRCRPYFIGLLGERYGWVPDGDGFPATLLEREPWLAGQRGHSVTEMEIYHGVLNDGSMAGHAFFYLRDPTYLDRLPPEARREDFGCASPADAERLRALKQRLRTSGLQVRENYSNAAALGELVLADLTAVIDGAFPATTVPDPLDRETARHHAFSDGLTRLCVGGKDARQWLSDCVANRLTRPIVVTGPAGSGKSALLARWVQKHQVDQAGPAVPLVLHCVAASSRAANAEAMARRIAAELGRQCGVGNERPIVEDPEILTEAFVAASRAGGAVVVVDGLDQIRDDNGASFLARLPDPLPPGVRLVVSTRAGDTLDVLLRRGCELWEMQPLTSSERLELIPLWLAQYSKALDKSRLSRIAFAPQTSSPAFLLALLEELRLHGDHFTLDNLIRECTSCLLVELYDRVLRRLERDYERCLPGLVGQAMSLLAVARTGLTEHELLQLLGGDDGPLPQSMWAPLYLATGTLLADRAGYLTIAYPSLGEVVERLYLGDGARRRAAHERLANFFDATQTAPGPTFERGFEELPWHLQRSGQWQRLYDFLGQRFNLRLAWQRNSDDMVRYWKAVEANSPLRAAEAFGRNLSDPSTHPATDWIVANLLAALGHEDLALQFRQTLAAGNPEEKNPWALAGHLNGQAATLINNGRLDEALPLLDRAEALYCKYWPASKGHLDVLIRRAKVHVLQGRLDIAGGHLNRAETWCAESSGYEDMAERLYEASAMLFVALGDLPRAMYYLQAQERLCLALGRELTTVFSNQAEVQRAMNKNAIPGGSASLARARELMVTANQAWDMRRVDDASGLFRQAEEQFQAGGDPVGVGSALEGQIVALLDRLDDGDFERAIELATRALPLFATDEERMSLRKRFRRFASGPANHAIDLAEAGRYEEALDIQRQAEHIFRRLNDLPELLLSLGNQATILRLRGTPRDALRMHREEIILCRQLGQRDQEARSYYNQAMAHADLKQFAEAIALAKEAVRVAEDLGFSAVVDGARKFLKRMEQKPEASKEPGHPEPIPSPAGPNVRPRRKWWPF
jgi:tetratricopeptide (TPR) repeat protein